LGRNFREIGSLALFSESSFLNQFVYTKTPGTYRSQPRVTNDTNPEGSHYKSHFKT